MGSFAEALADCVALVLLLVPAGLGALKALERGLHRRFHLTPPERLIIAFYASGALLFLLASIPLPLYGILGLLIILVGGAGLYGLLSARERFEGVRGAFRTLASPATLALGILTLGLLIVELLPVWSHPFPNAWDGGSTTLWARLLISAGTLPTSLAPFATAPVFYPLGATVWMSIPVLAFGWPLVQAPLLVPALFLSLSVPAAYCWGDRWYESRDTRGVVPLLFAGFFGLIASWPRLFTGGSYDFALGLPLFLVGLGFIPGFVRPAVPEPSRLLGFGILAGVLTTLSLAAGEVLVVLLICFTAIRHRDDFRSLGRWIIGVLIVVGLEMTFSARSVVGLLLSRGASFSPVLPAGSLNWGLIEGELDPFVPWKPKMSPFPALALELQVLLAAGLILIVLLVPRPRGSIARWFPPGLLSNLAIATGVTFGLTALLLFGAVPGSLLSGVGAVSNLDETSVILFTMYAAIALVPLVAAEQFLEREFPSAVRAATAHREPDAQVARRPGPAARSRGSSILWIALAVVVILIPIVSGATITILQVPASIQENVDKTSNVTTGDVAAMQWIGGNLPSCSMILVAPGSAGQFLPQFATVHIAFPMNPVPRNAAYDTVVANLTQGEYSSSARSALESLSVTTVFVTGQTSVTFLPFESAPLLHSFDFSLIFDSGDAFVFSFVPGVDQTGCAPL